MYSQDVVQPVKLEQKQLFSKLTTIYYPVLSKIEAKIFLALKQPEKHLCSVLYPKEIGDTFDDLQYILYTKRNKTLLSLPPTTNISHGHILRSHYVILICSNLCTRHKFES